MQIIAFCFIFILHSTPKFLELYAPCSKNSRACTTQFEPYETTFNDLQGKTGRWLDTLVTSAKHSVYIYIYTYNVYKHNICL